MVDPARKKRKEKEVKYKSNGVNSVNNDNSTAEKTTAKNSRPSRQSATNKADSQNFHDKRGEISRNHEHEWVEMKEHDSLIRMTFN